MAAQNNPNINAERIKGNLQLDESGSSASLNLKPGGAPSPNTDGDIWYDGTNLLAYLDGNVVQLDGSGGGAFDVGHESQVTGIALAFTITIPTQANTNYKVFITPTNATAAVYTYYVSSKATNNFELRYTGVPGGTTIEVDWLIIPD